MAYSDCASYVSIAPDFRAVGGAELRSGRSKTTLLAGGRDYGEKSASIDEPLLLAATVYDVKQERVALAGHRAHARGAGFPFDA